MASWAQLQSQSVTVSSESCMSKGPRYLENHPVVSSAKPDTLRPEGESQEELVCTVYKCSVGELWAK